MTHTDDRRNPEPASPQDRARSGGPRELPADGTPWERSYEQIWAPVITDFVAWVLTEAAQKGIHRLYFLARDGHPMYTAARALTAGDDRWDLRYLRVSRYALRIPEIILSPGDFLERIFLCGIDVSMRKILRRGGLDDREMAEVCRILGYDRPLDDLLERREIRTWQARAEAVWDQIWPYFETRSRQALDAARGYLNQEGLTAADTPCALVDSGWVGSTQRSLERLAGRPLEGFYFGLYDLPTGVQAERYHSYYFGPGTGINHKARFSNCLFEAVCSEASGMTLGYRQEGDRYAAVCAAGDNPNAARLRQALPVLTRYAEGYRQQAGGSPLQTDDAGRGRTVGRQQMSAHLLERLMRYPTAEEAELYGSLLFSDDVLDEGSIQPVAAALTYEDIRELQLSRKVWHLAGLRRDHPIHESGWIYGSIVRCGRQVEQGLRAAERYQRLLYLRKGLRWNLLRD